MTILPYNFCKVEKKLETLKWLWTPILSTIFFNFAKIIGVFNRV